MGCGAKDLTSKQDAILFAVSMALIFSVPPAVPVCDHWPTVGSALIMLSKERFPDRFITTYVSPRFRMLVEDFRYIDPVEGIILCKRAGNRRR